MATTISKDPALHASGSSNSRSDPAIIKLLKVLLETTEYHDVDIDTSVKILTVIMQGAIIPCLTSKDDLEYTDNDLSQVVMSLKGISHLLSGSFEVMFHVMDTGQKIYEWLIPNILQLIKLQSVRISTEVGFFIKGLLSSSSTAVYLYSSNTEFFSYLFNICYQFLQILQFKTLLKETILPEPLLEMAESYKIALEIIFIILQSFLREIKSDPCFLQSLSHSYLLWMYQLASQALNYMKSLIIEQHEYEVDRILFLFCDIFFLSYTIPNNRPLWCNLSIEWLLLVKKLSLDHDINSDLDITASSLAIDLIGIIVTGQAGGISCQEELWDPKKNDMDSDDDYSESKSKTAELTNVSKALNVIGSLLSSKDIDKEDTRIASMLSFNDSFLSKKVEKLRETVKRTTFTLSICTPGYQTDGALFAKLFDSLEFLSKKIESPDELKDYLEKNFKNLSLVNKVLLIRCVGISACYQVGTLDISSMRCKNCDYGIIPEAKERPLAPVYRSMFTLIIKSRGFQESILLRLETLKAMRRAMSGLEIVVDFENDIGLWVCQSLRSTSRDIRIAASMILPLYASSPRASHTIIAFLSNVNINVDNYLAETTIMAWSQLAKSSQGDQLNLILMKLLEFFALPNPFYTSLVMYYIRSIARYKQASTWKLFLPFWKTISVSVMKKKNTQPSILTRLCQVLEISTDEFIARTHSYTIPYIVLSGDRTTLESVAKSLKWSVEKLILEDMGNILSVLLMQETAQQGEFAKQCLIEITNSSRDIDLVKIVSSSRLEIAFEVLKLYDPADSKRSESISAVFQFIGNTLRRQSNNSSNSDAVIEASVERFFDDNILGIITLFSKSIRDNTGNVSYNEKLQCLNGLSKLAECAGKPFAKAVPQVCAVLQAALEFSLLQATAMTAWETMLRHMKSSDLENVTDLTFSVIIQNWSSFTMEAQKNARHLLQYLVVEEKQEMARIVATKGVPYMYGMLPDLADIYNNIKSMVKQPSLAIHYLNPLLRRSFDENIYIVRQTIREIHHFLANNQDSISLAMENATQRKYYIERLFKILLVTTHQFHNSKTDIPYLCSQCLGILGAADPTKIDISNDNRDIIVTHNFNDSKESISFVAYFLEHFLVKAFRASTNPSSQAFLAYGIQEYLRFCGLHVNSISEGIQKELWNYFSPTSQSIMLPMRSSRYTLTHSSTHQPETYPIFHVGIDHLKWLQQFTMDLLYKAKGNSNAEQVFRVCRKIIKDQDPSVFNFILPYVALNVVLNDNLEDRKNVINELLIIFNTDHSGTDDGNENMKRFYSSVFSVVDYFNKWRRHRQAVFGRFNRSKHNSKSAQAANKDSLIENVEGIMNKLSPDLMARRSYECKSYPRAIMYWEQHLHTIGDSNPKEKETIYSKFMEIYANINDPDSLDGVSRTFSNLSVPRKILQLENTGRWDDALECYESLSKSSNWNWDSENGYNMLRCMKQGGNYEALLSLLDSIHLANQSIPEQLLGIGVETSWLAGDFKKMESLLNHIPDDSYVNKSFEVNIGRAMLALQRSDVSDFKSRVDMARQGVAVSLASSPVSSFYQCQESLARLHGLADLETIGDLNEYQSSVFIDHRTISTTFNRRLEMAGSNYSTKSYLLALRRSAILSSRYVFLLLLL